MKKISYAKRAIICAASIALCVVLPMAFHAIPDAGSIFSPMHIPVLICGMICGWAFGLLCGLAGPFLSSILIQMPQLAYLPAMLVELSVYGVVSGLFYAHIRTRRRTVDILLSLIAAMLAGRIAAGLSSALIFAAGNYSAALWIGSYFVTSWPGIVLQLILIPAVITALEKSGLIPARYRKNKKESQEIQE